MNVAPCFHTRLNGGLSLGVAPSLHIEPAAHEAEHALGEAAVDSCLLARQQLKVLAEDVRGELDARRG